MKVKLLKDARIQRRAGEIVEVSPAQGAFLVSLKAAEIVDESAAPEKAIKAVKAEVPEKKTRAAKNK